MPRTTLVHQVDPDAPDPDALDEAAAILRRGGLVAFATETVYGLGADATNPEAVARIFEAKGRPPSNPLIVHEATTERARACVSLWPETAATLALQFWPGPLTFVLPRAVTIPDIVTAGQATVGVRVPETLVARLLIERAGVPVAAPSANRSNGISPTLARHVLDDLNGRIDLILDSGPTTVGLESTVLDLSAPEPRVLRPGPISAEALREALGGATVREAERGFKAERPLSPGLQEIHYAPRTRAIRVENPAALAAFDWPGAAALLVIGRHDLPPLRAAPSIVLLEGPEQAARDLYRVLHDCDRLGLDLIVIVPPPDRPEWRAIRDRLWRATRLNLP